jgi:hypothetical protein
MQNKNKITSLRKMKWDINLYYFKYKNKRYKLRSSILLSVENDNYEYFLTSELLNNHFVAAKNINDAVNEMEKLVGVLYYEYGLKHDDKLSEGGKKLKLLIRCFCHPLKLAKMRRVYEK